MMKDLSTLRKNDLMENVKKKQKKHTNKLRLYGSFFTLVLILCIIQLTYSGLLNVSKILSYRLIKIPKSRKLKDQALRRNEALKYEKSNFTTYRAEAIARDKLKMAKDNEYLVIMSEEEDMEKENPTFWEKILQQAETHDSPQVQDDL